MKEILEYIYSVTGFKVTQISAHKDFKDKLPLYITSLYKFDEIEFHKLNIKCIMATASEMPKSVIVIEKHAERIKEASSIPHIIFGLSQIPSRTAKRLIERRIPFINVGNQLFLPFLFMHLKTSDKSEIVLHNKGLSRVAETIVIRELIYQDLNNKTNIEISNIIKEGPMFISRALKELAQNGYGKIKTVGVRNIFTFIDKKDLWEEVKEKFGSLVESFVYVKLNDKRLKLLNAGISALAEKTLLSDDPIPTKAIYKREFTKLKEGKAIQLCDEEDADIKLEIWSRKPETLAKDNCIDIISLYLSLKDEYDDRVKIELKKLMQENGFHYKDE